MPVNDQGVEQDRFWRLSRSRKPPGLGARLDFRETLRMQIVLIIIFLIIPSAVVSLELSLKRTSGYLMVPLVLIPSQIVLTSLVADSLLRSYDSRTLLITNSLLALIFLVVGLVYRARLMETWGKIKKEFPQAVKELASSKFCVILALFVAAYVVCCVVVIYLLDPGMHDDLTYHLVMAAFWVQDASLDIIPTADYRCYAFPIYSEIINSWVFLFAGNGTWVELPQLLTGASIFIGVYSLSRLVEIGRRASYTAATLFFFSSPILYEMMTTHNDMLLIFFIICSLYFLLTVRDNWLSGTILMSISAGMMIGTKPFALTVVPFIFAAFLFLLATSGAENRANDGADQTGEGPGFGNAIRSLLTRKSLALIFGSALLIASVGGFIYIRNFIAFGSPLHPWGFKIFGLQIFPDSWMVAQSDFMQGVIVSTSPRVLLQNIQEEIRFWFVGQVDKTLGPFSGPGVIWPLLGLPAWALALSFSRKKFSRDYWLLSLVLLLSYCFFMSSRLHTRFDSRFCFYLYVPGLIAFAWYLSSSRKKIFSLTLQTLAVLCIALQFAVGVFHNMSIPLGQMFTETGLASKRDISSGRKYPWRFGAFTEYLDKREPDGCSIGIVDEFSMPKYLLFGNELNRRCFIITDDEIASLQEERDFDMAAQPHRVFPEGFWDNMDPERLSGLINTMEADCKRESLDYMIMAKTFGSLLDSVENSEYYEVAIENRFATLFRYISAGSDETGSL
jgi:hypothetical protein